MYFSKLKRKIIALYNFYYHYQAIIIIDQGINNALL